MGTKATKVPKATKAPMATKIPMATKVPIATKVLMATKVSTATKVPMATKSTKCSNCTKFNPRGLASYEIWACFFGQLFFTMVLGISLVKRNHFTKFALHLM